MSAIDEPTPSDLTAFFAFLQETEGAMTVPQTFGFLSAVVSAPSLLMPSVWQHEVWGEPELESLEEASAVVRTLMGLYNQIVHALSHGIVLGLDDLDDDAAVSEWCAGYLHAVTLDAEWAKSDCVGEQVFPMAILSGASELEGGVLEQARETSLGVLEDAVLQAYEHWRMWRQAQAPAGGTIVRGHPKTGRNEPCPCGSGKKFKRCCA